MVKLGELSKDPLPPINLPDLGKPMVPAAGFDYPQALWTRERQLAELHEAMHKGMMEMQDSLRQQAVLAAKANDRCSLVAKAIRAVAEHIDGGNAALLTSLADSLEE